MSQRYNALRGMRDLLPEEIHRWHFLEAAARNIFERYGFSEMRTPLMEPTELFTRSVGSSSDIVRKEMYTFSPGSESVTLRPENTASVVRAFVQHSLHRRVAVGYPERYYYIGPMFRHERPQKGRQRQFHQIGVEVLGAGEPLVDAETLEMVDLFLDELGIAERELRLSSVGDQQCRPEFREALQAWLEPRLPQLCDDCNRRYVENPLRVFDCKVERDRELLAEAPAMLDMLCDDCAGHLGQIRSILDDFGVPYAMDRRMVRGLDYYRRTVFEVVSSRLGSQDAILGGGRYDGLVEELGGPSIPGFGFAMGMERTVMLLGEDRVPAAGFDVSLITLGAEGWKAGIALARRLRRSGVSTLMPVAERPMGAQLKRADRAGARFAVFVGKDEMAQGRYGVKDLRTGDQESLDEQGLLARVTGEDDVD